MLAIQNLIALTPARAEDEAFLRAVYASTRAEEMALTGWNTAQQEAFLSMQFDAQRQYYSEHFPDAEYSVLSVENQAAGRLIVDRSGPAILLMDIALLPEYRGLGIGTRLIQDLQAEATMAGKPIRLHVEQFNRAWHLYERLGFSSIAEGGIYIEMEWRPLSVQEA